ncbi:MAG: hypothetical protein ACRYGP_30415 [Janthinobacterium lividum]
MFAEQIRAALPGTPRVRLAELAAAVWKGYACGAVSEQDAQQLADEIHARKAIPPTQVASRKPVGSRPRSPAHMERRRRWTGSGWLPPQLAARFTMAETAVLSTIAAEVAKRGLCRLTVGHIAVMAGVCKATVRTAVRQAVALGILTSEEWRLTAWRSAPNTIRIISPEWRAWLRMRDRKRAGADHPRHAETSAGSGYRRPAGRVQGGGSKFSDPLQNTDSLEEARTRKECGDEESFERRRGRC